MSEFPLPGQHVVVDRGIYSHHGIFMGFRQGQPIVAELAKPSDGGIVRFIPWATFTKGQPARIVQHEDGVQLQQVLANVGRVNRLRPYDLLNWNCEHFATRCATHKSRSGQVQLAFAALAALLLVKLFKKAA